MKSSLLGLLILLCSCSGMKARVEHGYGTPVAAGTLLIKKGSGVPLNLDFTRISLGRELFRFKSLSMELFGGGWSALPVEHESSAGFGISFLPRVSYLGFGDVRPYFGFNLGLGYADWKPQGSDFGFMIGHSLGVLYPVSEKWDVTLSWDLFHFSNAGTSDPNPGLNADMIVLGLEYKF